MRQNPIEEVESLFSELSLARKKAVDVSESDEAFTVRMDLPGYDEDDITVRLSDHTLHVQAERETETEQSDDEEYIRRERSHAAILRSVQLPETIDEDAAAATFEDGVLEIRIEKEAQPESEARTIPVT